MNGHEEWTDAVIAKIRQKMEWVSEKNREKIPYRTDGNGDYDDRSDASGQWRMDDGLNWWTNGFWGGIMWLLYQDTGEQRYADIARVSERKLEQCFADFYGLHHDVGFMFVPTAVADYKLTGNPDSRRIALHAATLLAGRFNPVGKFIRAWNDLEEDTRGWAIIDCMFNLSLLYWASEESKDPRFRQIAMLHADTVRKNFVRPDGSVCHIVEFDPETGEMVKSYGGQGCGEGSAWTRGQGWALYGFMISYIHTGKQEYLDTAKRVADYCLANILLRGLRDCGRSAGAGPASARGEPWQIRGGRGEDPPDHSGQPGRLRPGLRRHRPELQRGLPFPGTSFHHELCGLLFYRGHVQGEGSGQVAMVINPKHPALFMAKGCAGPLWQFHPC